MSIFRGLLFALALALLPTLALAAEFRTGEQSVTVGSGETIDDDLYIASGTVRVDGTVNGDVFAAGGQVTINGKVNGDLFVAGGQITLAGEVRDTVRVTGGMVNITGHVGRDLFVAGGTVELSKSSVVARDVWAGVGNLILGGTTGKINAGVGHLTVQSGAKVNGDLTYTSDNEASIESGATITGTSVRKEPRSRDWAGLGGVVAVGSVKLVFTLLMALLFLYLLPNKSQVLAGDWRQRFWSNLLWGFLFLIAVPIAAFILLVSIIASPVALGTMLLYPIFLYLGHLVAAIGLGTWIKNFWEREKTPRATWLAVVLGVAAFAILNLVPFVGWLLLFLFFLAGLGALVRYDWDIVAKLRTNKTL